MKRLAIKIKYYDFKEIKCITFQNLGIKCDYFITRKLYYYQEPVFVS